MTVSAPSDESVIWDEHTADTYQSDFAVVGEDISATLKYQESVTSFDMNLGHHFLCVHIEGASGSTIKAGLLPTQGSGMVTGDESGDFIFQINENTKQLVAQATKSGATQRITFDLNLELESE